MSFELTNNRRRTWCPEDPKGREHLTLVRWLEETMGRECGQWWLMRLDRLDSGRIGAEELADKICRAGCPELITLLYPLCPHIFLRPILYGRFNAVDLCAHYGSAAALETLLELGADPNGLDRLMETPFALHYDLLNRPFLYQPTPLDLARAAGQEDCRLVLALYGGVTAEELFSIPRGTLPFLIPTPDWVARRGQDRTISNRVYARPAPEQAEWRTWSVPTEGEE